MFQYIRRFLIQKSQKGPENVCVDKIGSRRREILCVEKIGSRPRGILCVDKIGSRPGGILVFAHSLLENRLMIDYQIVKSPVTSDFAAFSLIYYLKIDQCSLFQ